MRVCWGERAREGEREREREATKLHICVFVVYVGKSMQITSLEAYASERE